MSPLINCIRRYFKGKKGPMAMNGIERKCWHEVGHVLAAYSVGGSVEYVQLEDGVGHAARTNCNVTDQTRPHIACGGFAAEYLLYKKGIIRITQKELIDHANDSAADDKERFFGGDMRDQDGFWPEEMDNQFMAYSIDEVSPFIERNWKAAEKMVAVLVKNGRIERNEIELILKSNRVT